MVYGFGECELDEELYQLRRRGAVIKVEPKVFDLLVHLVRHRDRVVSKDDLLDAIWPGETVSESVLPHCVATARRAIGDDRVAQRAIQTVHGRGYRFIASVCAREATPPSVTEAGPAETVVVAPAATALPFVGRERALRVGIAALEATIAGRGRTLLLVGEPGIGKTRTAEELAARAERLGVSVLVGRCFDGEGAPAFWPWVQVLRAATRQAEPSALAVDLGPGGPELAELVPEIRERLPHLPRSQGIEGEQAQFRLFDAVAGYLGRASARRPFLVVLDDLHWADASSLRLVQFLAPELALARLLLVGTYRDVELRRAHPLAQLLGALAREPSCERIVLRGLEEPEVARMIEAIAGGPQEGVVVEAVREMTEGNPFFIHEVVRQLAEEGRLEAVGRDGASGLLLPQSVRDAIGRRLDALSDECNAALRAASVLGREFSGRVLARITGIPVDLLLEQLAEALAARVVVEASDGLSRYAFGHALIRQCLYEELRTPQRVGLHRAAGLALEAAYGADADEHAAELAHHFYEAAQAGDPVKAVHYSVAAAQRALRLLAYEEAARHYERALEALELTPPVDDARRCELLLAVGEARSAAGSRDEARATFVRVAELARRRGRPDWLARAALGHKGQVEMGVEYNSRGLLEEALAALPSDEPVLRARVLSRLTGTPPYSDSMETRDALSIESLELARRAGNSLAIGDALTARYWACLGPDRLDERLALAEEMLALSERTRDLRFAFNAYEAALSANLVLDRTAAADGALTGYVRVAQELRQPAFLFLSIVAQGSRALTQGRFDEAQAHYDQALARGRRTVPFAELMHAAQTSWLLQQRGRREEFANALGFVSELLNITAWRPLGLAAQAQALLACGEREAARRLLDELAAKGFADFPRDEHWLLLMTLLHDVTVELEDRARAELLYDLLLPYAHLTMVHDLIRAGAGAVATELGSLARLLGRYDEGAVWFEEGLARDEKAGRRPNLLSGKAGYALLLFARGAPGDARRAELLIQEVLAGCAELGIDALRKHPWLRDHASGLHHT
jgi:DNA-binding winged helix-turn-helix (wHTH) protein/tetratricopeptide (TPR) repeat protein